MSGNLYVGEWGLIYPFATNFDLRGAGASTLQKINLVIARPRDSDLTKTYLPADLSPMPIRKLLWTVLEGELSQPGEYIAAAEVFYGSGPNTLTQHRITQEWVFTVKPSRVKFLV